MNVENLFYKQNILLNLVPKFSKAITLFEESIRNVKDTSYEVLQL